MANEPKGEVPIRSESDIVLVRGAIRDAANVLGFGITDVTRIVTAASELARNIVLYAGSGLVSWHVLRANNKAGLELCFVDQGPGIPNLELAMQTGYSTSGGLGMGLPGVRRLMDETAIDTVFGQGTTIKVIKWLRN